MKRFEQRLLRAGAVLLALAACHPAQAQKHGGILRVYSSASPANMSILEAPTIVAEMPLMGVFNNLVMFDQHTAQVSLQSIVPDLATEWSWSEDGTELTFKLRHGVKWHDGQPFTAKDVVCTWDLMKDKAPDKLRLNPRKSSYDNLAAVTTNGDYEVTFHLKRPQPAFPMLLAGGFSAIYPVTCRQRKCASTRSAPARSNSSSSSRTKTSRWRRTPDYWKPDRPYLDGIEYSIIADPSTANLAFVTGKVDMTLPYDLTAAMLNDVKSQMPQANCELTPGMIPRHMLINRDKPPFNDPEPRRAMALSIDRKAFIDIIAQGQGEIGGVLEPPPGGLWGTPADRDRHTARLRPGRAQEPRRGPPDHAEARLRAGQDAQYQGDDA